MAKINYQRGETRSNVQEYRYTNTAANRIKQDAANTSRRREGRREAQAQTQDQTRGDK